MSTERPSFVESQHVHGDAPVGRDGDRLRRRSFADLIARQIRASRPANGLVVAIDGAWGTGKTSILRMVGEALAENDTDGRTIVIEFNPWLFSGSEQLTALFFMTLAEQLPNQLGPTRLSTLAQRLGRYGRALGTLRALPLFGGFFGAGEAVAAEGARRLDQTPTDVVCAARTDR